MARCPVGMQVQSLVFDREEFTRAEARAWAKRHGYQHEGLDVKPGTYRIRQKHPRAFQSGTFRTIHFGSGIEAVVACPAR